MVALATPDPLRAHHETRVSAMQHDLNSIPETVTRQSMDGKEAVNRATSEMHALLTRLRADPSFRNEVAEQNAIKAQHLERAASKANEAGDHSRLFVLAGMIADLNRHMICMLPENDLTTL